MEGGPLDGGTGEGDRLQIGHRGYGSGTSDLIVNGKEGGEGLLGLELIGRGPAGRLGRIAQTGLEGQVVHLDDDAVRCERQVLAAGVPLPIKDAFQATAAHLFRVEGLEGARGSVAGVGKGSVPYIRTFLVQGVEGREGHVDLAPYLKVPGHVPDVGRYGGDGPDIVGDVISDRSVPAGQGPDELSSGVTEADGRAVEFQFTAVGEFLSGGLAYPSVKVLQFLNVIGIAEREHGPAVTELTEFPRAGRSAGYVAAYFYCRRVGRSQFGIHLFQGGQLHHHYIVLKIRYLGIIEHIVPVVVPVELLPQELYSLLCVGFIF